VIGPEGMHDPGATKTEQPQRKFTGISSLAARGSYRLSDKKTYQDQVNGKCQGKQEIPRPSLIFKSITSHAVGCKNLNKG